MKSNRIFSNSPEQTFEFGEKVGERLSGGELIFLKGSLGAGKTLLTKGILSALDFDVFEVTSPSFSLVNHYPTPKFDVYHIDLWRLEEGGDVGFAVGLDEIAGSKTNVAIIEWAEKLDGDAYFTPDIIISIEGDGDDQRAITILEGGKEIGSST